MRRPLPISILSVVLLALPGAAMTGPDWTKLKAGMKAEEAAKELGEPLLRTNGRGFEVWIYDGRGEMLFAGGPLKAWTVAAPSAESLARPVAQDVLIRAVRRPPSTRLGSVQSLPATVRTYQDLSATHFRYRP